MVTRSRIETFEWITQSLPMCVSGPMVTLGKMTVRSPIVAPSPMATNAPIGDIAAEPDVAGDGRQRVHPGRRTPGRSEQPDGARERQIGVARTQHRAGRRRRVVTENDRRGAVAGSSFSYFGLARKVMSPWAGILDPGDAHDVDVPVAFEPAIKPPGKLPQFHC